MTSKGHSHPITIRVTFSFPELISACKKIAQFIILETTDFKIP